MGMEERRRRHLTSEQRRAQDRAWQHCIACMVSFPVEENQRHVDEHIAAVDFGRGGWPAENELDPEALVRSVLTNGTLRDLGASEFGRWADDAACFTVAGGPGRVILLENISANPRISMVQDGQQVARVRCTRDDINNTIRNMHLERWRRDPETVAVAWLGLDLLTAIGAHAYRPFLDDGVLFRVLLAPGSGRYRRARVRPVGGTDEWWFDVQSYPRGSWVPEDGYQGSLVSGCRWLRNHLLPNGG